MSKHKENKWRALKDYVNARKIGTVITRKEILHELNERLGVFCTIDAYKGILLNLGILQRDGNGKYKILYHIKSDASVSEARKAAYSNSWRTWFNDFKEQE